MEKKNMIKRDPVCNMEVREDEAIIMEENGKTLFFCSKGCKEKHEKRKELPQSSELYDLVIIGGGPAGLTAGVYAAIMRLKAFLISGDLGGQAIDSTKVKNYMGYDFISGPDLIDKFQDQLLHSNYIDHFIGEVDQLSLENENKILLKTSNDKAISAKAVIIATGMKRRKLGIPGEEKYQRKGIFYGNIQDISFVKDKNALVIGGGNSAMQIVENLQSVAKTIYLVSDIPLTADPVIVEKIRAIKNLVIFESRTVLKFWGEENLQHAEIKKTNETKVETLDITGAFIAIGLQPNSALAAHILTLNKKGEIPINNNCSTSVPGVFAAGDVTDAFGKRIVIASGEGAKAALAARQYLLDLKRAGKH